MNDLVKEWLHGLVFAGMAVFWLMMICLIGVVIFVAIDSIRERRKK